MRDSGDAMYRRTLRALRAECPTAMSTPVRVRWRTDGIVTKDFGWTTCSRDGRSLIITVARRVRKRGRVRDTTPEERRDTLMHEWAHAMGWFPENHPNLTDHDAVWGICMSRVYAAVVED